MNTHTQVIKDTTYFSAPDPKGNCENCVGLTDPHLCDDLSMSEPNCYSSGIIWLKPETTNEGRKFDNDKPQFALVPPMALIETVKVLTYGAQKYAPGNWRKVPDAKNRYFGAAMRHMWSWLKGEKVDPETGISHLAHALCSILFILELELEEKA